jgi:hypothetical protein
MAEEPPRKKRGVYGPGTLRVGFIGAGGVNFGRYLLEHNNLSMHTLNVNITFILVLKVLGIMQAD